MNTSSSSSKPLAGRNMLVTGASTGIGSAVARRLGAGGATVCVNYHGSEADARATADAIEESGGRAIVIRADVSDENSVRTMFERFSEEAGPLDSLVANAGIQKDAAIETMSLDDWQQVLSINLTGQFLSVREAIRQFDRKPWQPGDDARGSIVCMSSVHEFIPWAGHVNYASAKGGIRMMMKSVAQEVASRGIRVNGVAPGAIATDINAAERESEEERASMRELIPYGRIGDPDDVAKAAEWLLSDASDYVIGSTLVVDGGMSLYPAFIGNG